MSDSGNAPPPPPPPPGGGYGAPPPPGGGYYGQPPAQNKKAVWALVLGIIGLLCCGFITGIPAIILGRQAQSEVDASGGAQTGRGLATAGFVLGIIAVVWGVIYLILVLTGAINFNFNTSTS